ncbi:DUF924 family protein [Microvirga pudoricolor]|uniref:DUF924 family protein n=1 Tax=Microvirga pudoricolor TaxID=2778729 RepID=UPI00194E8F93|nr:DUF924 family protein [Microvirga pudoricolor]MBM6596656.1 DUF924 domain-containing protein [Microvirga pudoricolor]
MLSPTDWQRVYDFWFPASLSRADAASQWRRLEWWMRGGATPELPPFIDLVQAARSDVLDRWLEVPHGRLCLIILLDQFPRGLFGGTPDAFASDTDALRIAEEGFRNGHFEALADPWERFFFFLPLAHAEGPDHLDRMRRVVVISERVADQAPENLRPIWEFSLKQARDNFTVISKFGRFPHRNSVLGRLSTPAEEVYLAKGDFVHQRELPTFASE